MPPLIFVLIMFYLKIVQCHLVLNLMVGFNVVSSISVGFIVFYLLSKFLDCQH